MRVRPTFITKITFKTVTVKFWNLQPNDSFSVLKSYLAVRASV